MANLSRYRNLQVSVRSPSNEPVMTAGGRWDTGTRSYVGAASWEVRVKLSPSQIEASRELFSWLRRHAEVRQRVAKFAETFEEAEVKVWGDEEPSRVVIYYGGRRAGKSWLACLAVTLYALMVPGCRVVMLSPLQRDTAELQDALFSLLHSGWRTWHEGRQEFRLVNGSRIELKTGRKKQLKLGPTDLAVVNEAQEQEEQPCLDVRGNLADRGGLMICTANPPRRKLGQWVQKLVWAIRDGVVKSAQRFFLDWKLNPYTNHRALRALAEGMSELERRREIDGDMDLPVGDIVLSSFGQHNIIERIPVTWRRERDVTAEVLERWFGVRGCTRVVGTDFDKIAGCSWITGRFYLRRDSSDIDDAIFVVDYGGRFKGKSEKDFGPTLAAMTDRAGRKLFDLERTLIVADNTGKNQSTERTARRGNRKSQLEDPPSWTRLRAAGWRHIVGPDPNMDCNPSRRDRFDCTRDVLRAKWGKGPRVLFVSETAGEVIESAWRCPMEGSETGNPNRRSEYAHVLDCWSYICWRRWGADWLELLAEVRASSGEGPQFVEIAKKRPKAL